MLLIFNFITSPEFVMGTSGAFAGGLIVQKQWLRASERLLHSVRIYAGGPFVRRRKRTPALGAMVGSDLLTVI